MIEKLLCSKNEIKQKIQKLFEYLHPHEKQTLSNIHKIYEDFFGPSYKGIIEVEDQLPECPDCKSRKNWNVYLFCHTWHSPTEDPHHTHGIALCYHDGGTYDFAYGEISCCGDQHIVNFKHGYSLV